MANQHPRASGSTRRFHLSGEGSPVTLGFTREFPDQLYQNTSNDQWWKSTGPTSADWELVND